MNLLIFLARHGQRDILIRCILVNAQLHNAARLAADCGNRLVIAAKIVYALAVDGCNFIVAANARLLCRRIGRHRVYI